MSGSGDPETVLDFWFGELDAHGRADTAHTESWWKKDDRFDATIRERFAGEHAAIRAGTRSSWRASDRGRLAWVVVLDQFSRNMFRGTPAMFESDDLARAVAVEALELGDDRRLPLAMRSFLYMPFMHSECLADQDRCVALFSALRDEQEGDLRKPLEGHVGFAAKHRDIVARFGRFPHRNAILGRPSTAEELAFLQEPGSSF